MRQITKTKLLGLFVIVVMGVGGAILTQLSLAAAGQIYVSPGTTNNVTNGANLTVALRINPGGSVDSVDVTLAYDTTKLQFVSIDSNGSNFPGSILESGGNGQVHIVRFIGGGSTVNSDALISRVTFKSLSGSGSTVLSLAGSQAAYSGAYTNPALVNGTVNFTTPVTPPPPVQPPSPSPTPTPSPTTKPTPSPTPSTKTPSPAPTTPTPSTSPTPPSPTSKTHSPTPPPPAPGQPVCNATVASLQFTSATLHVTCTSAARVFVKFGTEGQLIESTTPTATASDTTDVTLTSHTIKPGSIVSYAVVAISSSGQQYESVGQSLTTKGYTIKIKALAKNRKALANRQFTLRSEPRTAKSDRTGTVSFSDVAPGRHTLEILNGKTKTSQELTVQDNFQTAADGSQTAAVQNFSVIFQNVSVGSSWLVMLVCLLVIIALVVAAWWSLLYPAGPRLAKRYLYQETPPTKKVSIVSGSMDTATPTVNSPPANEPQIIRPSRPIVRPTRLKASHKDHENPSS